MTRQEMLSEALASDSRRRNGVHVFGSALPRRHPALNAPDQHARPVAQAQVMADRQPLRSECPAVDCKIL
jgi:hypothetical protein